MSQIKIVSGFTHGGGSTHAYMNLCDLFNENGYDCTFYGRHPWHLDKCSKGALIQNLEPEMDDTFLVHYFRIDDIIPMCKKMVLSVHEKNMFPIKDVEYSHYNFIHYINDDQRKWQAIDHPYHIIPNVYDDLKEEEKTGSAAGIIGTIDRNKNTHVSIRRALDKGYNSVLLYGEVTDKDYYEDKVKPLLNDKVIQMGHCGDKQEMYNSVESVFLSSDSEVAPLVKGECKLTGTNFYGNKNTEGSAFPVDRKEILDMWVKALEL